MYWDFNGWACNPVPGPQDAQRRVAIIVTTSKAARQNITTQQTTRFNLLS